MKMTFRGWRREVMEHSHSVAPVRYSSSGGYTSEPAQNPLKWCGPFKALGKMNDLKLGGSFLVEFNFEEQEIENWLSEYVKAHPENALRVLARAQAEATIALSTWQRPTINT